MKVAVVGAGASGLTAIKACKEYGFDVVCFEKNTHIGGLWKYKSVDSDGDASVMKSTIINTSKEMSSFSDFPPPKEFSNFMHNTKVFQYLEMYAQKFELIKHVRFNHHIRSVRRSDNYEETGQWTVEYETEGIDHIEVFDAVFMCNGHHIEPHIPHFKGLNTFKGQVIHTRSLKTLGKFEDKRVMVIGIGNSGGDAATELARVANMVYLITRRGSWVIGRIGDYGYPADLVISRFYSMLTKWIPGINIPANKYLIVSSNQMPYYDSGGFIESFCNRKFDHELYGLKPNHRVLSQHTMTNDDLPGRIAAGTLKICPSVEEFFADGAVLEDGSRLDAIDVVILATGYNIGFPCLEDGVVPVKENRLRLYRYLYSPYVSHPETLVMVGCVQPFGSLFPIAEMQCRVACDVLSGITKLPSIAAMNNEIDATISRMAKRYVETRRHTIQVDYNSYVDQLSCMIGANPHDWKQWITDPVWMSKLMFGPLYPYQYRLRGPHSWTKARQTIETAMERIEYPLRYSKSKALASQTSMWSLESLLKIIFGFVALLICLYFIS